MANNTENLQVKTNNSNMTLELEKVTLECPVFIIFSEYFGYVSSFLKVAEAWCNGNVPELHVQKFLKIEAASIFRQMRIDYTLEEIRDYYERYYPLIIKEWVCKLEKIIATTDGEKDTD